MLVMSYFFSQIIRVNMLPPFAGKPRLAYVEFGDEETMKAGLEKHAEVCLVYPNYPPS